MLFLAGYRLEPNHIISAVRAQWDVTTVEEKMFFVIIIFTPPSWKKTSFFDPGGFQCLLVLPYVCLCVRYSKRKMFLLYSTL